MRGGTYENVSGVDEITPPNRRDRPANAGGGWGKEKLLTNGEACVILNTTESIFRNANTKN